MLEKLIVRTAFDSFCFQRNTAAHRLPDALPFCSRVALSLICKNFDSVTEMLRDVLIQFFDPRAFLFRG